MPLYFIADYVGWSVSDGVVMSGENTMIVGGSSSNPDEPIDPSKSYLLVAD